MKSGEASCEKTDPHRHPSAGTGQKPREHRMQEKVRAVYPLPVDCRGVKSVDTPARKGCRDAGSLKSDLMVS